MNIEKLVSDSYHFFGEAVTRTFVLSFALKYGSESNEAIRANSIMAGLTGAIESPSAQSAAMFNDAVLRIPNSRKSSEAGLKFCRTAFNALFKHFGSQDSSLIELINFVIRRLT